MFSDTPPAPSFQSILCKLQPLMRHSVRHLPYNIRGAALCKFATDLFEAAVSCCNFAQGIARILCRTFPKRVGKTHRIALFPYAATVGKTHRLPPEQLHFTQGIPAPLPRRDPRTCWKTTQDRPVPRVAIYTGLAVLGLFATLRRLLSAQENGGGMHRLQLVEHTGLRC